MKAFPKVTKNDQNIESPPLPQKFDNLKYNTLLNYTTFGTLFPCDFLSITCNCLHLSYHIVEKVQVGNDQEKAQSEKDSNSKNRGGKKLN